MDQDGDVFVLGLVYLEEQAALPGESTIRLAVMATVLLSIFAHGLSALPGIDLYADRLSFLDSGAPEFQLSEQKTPASRSGQHKTGFA